MTEKTQPDLASQFREMGENLKDIFRSTWESVEVQKLKEEMKDGINELSTAATQAVEDFNVSESGKRIKAEAEEFKSRVESGEVESRAREEISNALNLINAELSKAIEKISPPKSDSEE
jgi:hypothetical protein